MHIARNINPQFPPFIPPQIPGGLNLVKLCNGLLIRDRGDTRIFSGISQNLKSYKLITENDWNLKRKLRWLMKLYQPFFDGYGYKFSTVFSAGFGSGGPAMRVYGVLAEIH